MVGKRFVRGWFAGLAAGLTAGAVISTTWLAGAGSSVGPWVQVEKVGFTSGNEFHTYPYSYQLGYVAGVWDALGMAYEAIVKSPEPSALQDAIRLVESILPADQRTEWAILTESGIPEINSSQQPTMWVAAWLARGTAYQDGFFNLLWDLRLPDGVNLGQVTDVVTKYVNEHPEERHLSAAWLVWKAVAEAFHPGIQETSNEEEGR